MNIGAFSLGLAQRYLLVLFAVPAAAQSGGVMTGKIQNYFSLGFAGEPEAPKIPLMLGRKRGGAGKRLLREVSAWLLVACGIFSRKALVLKDLRWDWSGLTVAAFLASVVIALATFPLLMKWLNRRRPKVGLEQFATSFAFGFFLDLAAVSALRVAPKLF